MENVIITQELYDSNPKIGLNGFVVGDSVVASFFAEEVIIDAPAVEVVTEPVVEAPVETQVSDVSPEVVETPVEEVVPTEVVTDEVVA